MNIREVKTLVDKYFEGETTLLEEEELCRFFNSENVPEELQDLIPVFNFIRQEKKVVTSEKLNTAIHNTAFPAKMIPLYRKRSFWLTVSGIAASILLTVVIVIESGKIQLTDHDKFASLGYTREEARIALDQTRQVLAYVSGKYNRGVESLSEVSKIELSTLPLESIGKFSRSLDNLSKNVDKFDKGVDQLDKLSKIDIIIKL